MFPIILDPNFGADSIEEALRNLGYSPQRLGATSPKSENSQNVRPAGKFDFDYADVPRIEERLGSLKSVCLLPGCTDVGLESWSKASKRLKDSVNRSLNVLPYLNKASFQEVCEASDIPHPSTSRRLADVRGGTKRILAKPLASFSGKGISEITDGTQSVDLKSLENSAYLYQEYIEGPLYSYSAIFDGGLILDGALVREFCVQNPYRVDVSYVEPNEMVDLHESLITHTTNLAKATHLKRGLIHVQFILSESTPYFLEATLRMPGDNYPRLVELSHSRGYVTGFLSGFTTKVKPVRFTTDSPKPVLRVTASLPPGEAVVQKDLAAPFKKIHQSQRLPVGSKNLESEPIPCDVKIYSAPSWDEIIQLSIEDFTQLTCNTS